MHRRITLSLLFLVLSSSASTLFPYTTLFRSLNAAAAFCVTSAGKTASGIPARRAASNNAWLGRHIVQDYEILDRKSTRLNSSHLVISYAVFCLKKKKQ